MASPCSPGRLGSQVKPDLDSLINHIQLARTGGPFRKPGSATCEACSSVALLSHCPNHPIKESSARTWPGPPAKPSLFPVAMAGDGFLFLFATRSSRYTICVPMAKWKNSQFETELAHGLKRLRDAQGFIRQLQAAGWHAEIRKAMLSFGFGNVTVDQFLTTETVEDMVRLLEPLTPRGLELGLRTCGVCSQVVHKRSPFSLRVQPSGDPPAIGPLRSPPCCACGFLSRGARCFHETINPRPSEPPVPNCRRHVVCGLHVGARVPRLLCCS